jgi:DNA replication and repair protein RecF
MNGFVSDGAPMVRRLILSEFRSYPALDLAFGQRLIAFMGENGAGKTNLLEALSLFAVGRGLRRADLPEMAREGGSGGFAVSILVETDGGEHRLGTALEPAKGGGFERTSRIDRNPVSSASAFADFVRLVWLTPALDGLFTGAPGDRRRFLDRLVLAVDPAHGSRVNALEKALRSRNKLLEAERLDAAWLEAVEREVAETGVAVAMARQETVGRLKALIADTRQEGDPFPWAALTLEGPIDAVLGTASALEIEDLYRGWLRDNRLKDRAAGRTLIGPQATDLLVRHGPKDVAADRASTGEQKALLVGLVLAHARLVAAMTGIVPIVLLDEVAAHLDPRRRAGLYAALDTLGAQVFMTGADPALFGDLPANSMRLAVTGGRVFPAP